MLVYERRRAEDLAGGEGDPAPRLLHSRLALKDLTGDVFRRVGVVGALHVEVGPDEPDCLDGSEMGIDGDKINALEASEHLGVELLWEGGAVRPLVHEPVGRERDDEHVAYRLGLMEIPQVPDVEQVEDPVAVDDPPARRAEAGQQIIEFGDGLNFSTCGRYDLLR